MKTRPHPFKRALALLLALASLLSLLTVGGSASSIEEGSRTASMTLGKGQFYPDTGLFLYASTREIMENALKMCSQPRHKAVKINMTCGEIVKIDHAGEVTRGTFDDSKLLSWYPLCCRPRYHSDGSYIGELKSVAYAYGFSPEMIDRLIALGYPPEEIEAFLYEV